MKHNAKMRMGMNSGGGVPFWRFLATRSLQALGYGGLDFPTGPAIRPFRPWVDSSGVVRGLDLLKGAGTFLAGPEIGFSDESAAGGSATWTTPGSLPLISNGTGAAVARFSFTTVVDRIYTVYGKSATAITLNVGTAAGGTQYGTSADISSTPYVTFTATGTTAYFDFTHVAAATRILYDVVAFEMPNSKQIRIDSTQGDPRLLTAPASVQIYSGRGRDILKDFTASNATGAANATGADGAANMAATLTDADGANAGYYYRNFSVAANSGPWTIEVRIPANASPTAYPAVGMWFSGSTAKSAGYCLNPTDGTSTAITADQVAAISIQNIGLVGNFYVWAITGTDNGSNTTLQLRAYPAWAETEAAAVDAASQGSNVFDMIQLSYGISHADSFVGNGWTPEVLGAELVTNGTMELDANWANSATPTTNERSAEQAHTGTYSRKVISDSAFDGIQGDGYTTITGGLYKVVAWVYPVGTTVCRINIRNGSNSSFLHSIDTTGLTDSAWNKVEFYYTDTAGGSGAYLLALSGSASYAATFYWDDISIKQVTSQVYIGSTAYYGGSPELTSGTLIANHRYHVSNGTVDGHAVGTYFTAAGTETPDATNRVYDLGPIRESEAGAPDFISPAIFGSDFTFAAFVTLPHAASAFPAGNHGYFSADGNAQSVLYFKTGKVCTYDGANETEHSITLPANTEALVFVRCTGSTATVGSVIGGVLTSTDGTWDGAHAMGASVSFGEGIYSPAWTRSAILEPKALTLAQIAAIK